MKRNLTKTIGLVLLIIIMQTVCFADVISPDYHGTPKGKYVLKTSNDTIEVTKGQLGLLILLIAIAFISLFVVIYFFINKYSSNNRSVYSNSENIQEDSGEK